MFAFTLRGTGLSRRLLLPPRFALILQSSRLPHLPISDEAVRVGATRVGRYTEMMQAWPGDDEWADSFRTVYGACAIRP